MELFSLRPYATNSNTMPSSLSKGTEPSSVEHFRYSVDPMVQRSFADCTAENASQAIAAANAKAADEMAALEKFLLEEEYPKIKIAAELAATEKFLLGEEYDKVSRHTAKAALAEAKIAEEFAATEKFLLGGDYEIMKGACGRARVQGAC